MHINMITKYYFINKFETNNIDKQDKQTIIIYRNYSSKTLNEKLILDIKKYCKKKGIKFYLSNHLSLEYVFHIFLTKYNLFFILI